MSGWRTVLFCERSVWGDGIRRVLEGVANFDLVAIMPLEEASLAQVGDLHPDVIFVATDEIRGDVQAFITRLMDVVPDVPLVVLSLSDPHVRLVRTRPLPSRWEALLQFLDDNLQRDRKATEAGQR